MDQNPQFLHGFIRVSLVFVSLWTHLWTRILHFYKVLQGFLVFSVYFLAEQAASGRVMIFFRGAGGQRSCYDFLSRDRRPADVL